MKCRSAPLSGALNRRATQRCTRCTMKPLIENIDGPRTVSSLFRFVQEYADVTAFDEVYQLTIKEMKLWIAYRCHRWDMIEECLQATYVTALKRSINLIPTNPSFPG